MFYVTDTLRFYFKHDIDPDTFDHVTGSTLCIIQEKIMDDWNNMAFGQAYCHPNDQFTRVKGRKVSLANALSNYTRDRHERKLFWDALFAKAKRE